jgi:hypothetical protein
MDELGLGKALPTLPSHDTITFHFATLDFQSIDEEAFKAELLDQFRKTLNLWESQTTRLSITLREGSVIAEVSGKPSVVQTIFEKASTKHLAVMGSTPTVRATGSFARSGSEKSFASQKPRFVGLKPRLSDEESQLILEGPMGYIKKAAQENRYLVLMSDRFDLYKSKDDFAEGRQPGTRALLNDVQDFQILDDGFDAHLRERVYQLRPDSESLERWSRAFKEVFDFEITVPRAPADESTKKKRKSSPPAPLPSSWPNYSRISESH